MMTLLFQRRLLLAALVVCAGLTGACAGSAPEIRHYMLDLDPARQPDTAKRRPVMGVEQFSVEASYDETKIAYRDSPYRLNYYYYHRWASSPGRLVADALRGGYQKTGLFSSVRTGEVARTDVVLSGHVSAVEEVDVASDKWIGHIAMELRLRDTATGTVLWTRVFEQDEPMTERNPTGVARAISTVVTQIVADSAPQLARAARQAGAGG